MSRLMHVSWFIAGLSLLAASVACSEAPEVPKQLAFVRGEVIIRYAKEVEEADEEVVLERHGLTRIRQHRRIGLDHVRTREERDVLETIEALKDDPDVLYAEPNYLYYPTDLPGDWNSKLWGLHNDGSYGTTDADMDVREAWNTSTGSHDIIVAVVDTGVDWDHPDLADNIWHNPGEIAGNGVDDDGNGYTDDTVGYDFYSWDNNPNDNEGHGTHVAGTIGAVGDNGQGVVGVNWDVTIMPLRFLGPNGGSSSSAAAAIEYAVDHGAHVINNSWGSYGYSNAIRDAIAYANDHGVLFTAAAGNESNNNDGYAFYPASYDLPNIVSVASTTSSDGRSSFSNWGASKVDVGAPGSDIYSLWPGGGTAWLSGTSMATPNVSGVLALALSVDPSLSPAELKELLMQTVDVVPSMQGRVASDGRVNADALLAAIGTPPPEEEEPPPEEEEPPPEEEEPPPEEEEPPPEEEEPPPEEEEPPPEEEEPPPEDDGWTFVAYPLSSAHPYADHARFTKVVQHAGASEIKLHFDAFETEEHYDVLKVRSQGGEDLALYHGTLGAFVTDPFPVDWVLIRLLSDYSVTDHGFDLSGYSWR